MALVNAFHSTRPGETVYHNDNVCTEGNNIEKHYWALGDGGLTLCSACRKLNLATAFASAKRNFPKRPD
jgi:hypothetical protein